MELQWSIEPADVLLLGGKDSLEFVHRMSTGNLRKLSDSGALTQTLFVNAQGKLLDWCTALRRPDGLLLCTSPGRSEALWAWLKGFVIMDDVQRLALPEPLCTLRIFGEQAPVLAGLQHWPASQRAAEHQGAVLYRGSEALGPHLVVLAPSAPATALQALCAAQLGPPLGAHALNVKRLQAGMPQAETEFPAPCNPFELRLGRHAIAWNKGCYIGQEVLSRLDSYDKVARLLMGFEADNCAEAQRGARVVDESGLGLGKVTSSATNGAQTLGLCIVKRTYAEPQRVYIDNNLDKAPAELINRPFF